MHRDFTTEGLAQAMYTEHVDMCGGGLFPEWKHLDIDTKELWITKAKQAAEGASDSGQTFRGVRRNSIIQIVPETKPARHGRELLVRACVVRGQQLYENSEGMGLAWADLGFYCQLQWVALAQAEFLSAYAQVTPEQFLESVEDQSCLY